MSFIREAAALPLMFELSKVNAERYSDNCCCKSEKQLLVAAGDLQRQLDHKITGQLKYAYSDLQFLVFLHYTVVHSHNMAQVCMLGKLLLTGMQ